MPLRQPVRLAALVLAAAFLAGATECTYRGRPVGGGTDEQWAVGPVARFGSVFVNGDEYDTGSTTVTIDGATATVDQLRIGQVATVEGTKRGDASTWRGLSLVVDHDVRGPVFSVDLAGGTLEILDQTIEISGETTFGDGLSLTGLAGVLPGERLRIDGYRATDRLLATRVERAPDALDFRLVGQVSELNTVARTFRLHGTTVEYGIAQVEDGVLRNGAAVVVVGAAFAAGPELRATLIQRRAAPFIPGTDDTGEVEGVVTRLVDPTDFDVGDRRVVTDRSTVFAGGTSADLKVDRRVEVAGVFDAEDRLVARRVEFEPEPTFAVLAEIDRIDSGAGTLTVGGLAIATGAATRWVDHTTAALRTLDIRDLRVGEWVQVLGLEGAAAKTATAAAIERWPTPEGVRRRLQAVPESLDASAGAFTLADTPVTTRGATYLDAAGATIARGAFYAAAPGRVVRVRGRLSGDTFLAEIVELRP